MKLVHEEWLIFSGVMTRNFGVFDPFLQFTIVRTRK